MMVSNCGVRQGLGMTGELHNLVAFTAEEFNSDEFETSGMHKKHAVTTWDLREPSQHFLQDRDAPRKLASMWPVSEPSGCTLTSG
jgi:hypothetical protein